jgi:hypothetical protein
MTAEKTIFFTLADEYARSNFRCFLAEMDLRSEEHGYYLCFRPLDVRIDSPARYACKYVLVPVAQVKSSASARELSDLIIERLAPELSLLRQSD